MPKLYHNGRAWQLPGQQDTGATRVDVPSSPAELVAWLEARGVPPIAGGAPGRIDLSGPGDPLELHVSREHAAANRRKIEDAERRAARAAEAVERDSAEGIADWILHAPEAQCASLFAALGARFHHKRSK